MHPDIELEKTSRHLGLGYKACLHCFFLHTFHFMSLNASLFFISSLIIEKEHLASFCCTKQEEKSSSVCWCGVTWLLAGFLSPTWVCLKLGLWVRPLIYIWTQRRGPPPHSYGGDPHHHLPVGGGANPGVVGPQLAQDVQDGVSTVVVQNSS